MSARYIRRFPSAGSGPIETPRTSGSFFLVEQGLDAMLVSEDAVLKTLLSIAAVESGLAGPAAAGSQR